MIVIFDIDDCLMPWAERVHEACVVKGLAEPDSTWTQWGMWEDYGCTKQEWIEVVNAMVVPGGIYHAPPYEGVVEAVQKLVDLGHEVHLVTARGFFDHAEEIREWTVDWLQTFKIPGTLWFSQNKGEIAAHISATHAVDDRYENCVDLWSEGLEVYMMNQPHNKNSEWPAENRVDSIPEFVERILS